MKIFVTGAAGFIGSHTCEALSTNHEVMGIDSFDPYYPREIKRENLRALLTHPTFTFEEQDILALSELESLIKTFRPDVVLHLAARAGVRPSVQFPQKYIDTNVSGTLNVLQVCAEAGVEKLLFASSSSVYGNGNNGPCKEDQILSPLNVYAASKVAGEALCQSFSQLSGMKTVCLRFFTVYGPRQRPDMAIPKFVKSILASELIELRGGSESARDYTYVSDIVNGIVRIAETHLSNRHETFNLGSAKPVLLSALIENLGAQLGIKPIVKNVPLPPEEAEITHADVSKAQRMVGYYPAINISDGVANYVKWAAVRAGAVA